MRIWDVPPSILCRQHLLGEHREPHALWVILTDERRGYARHPETIRWHGKQAALFRRHEQLIDEMARRGYQHASPFDERMATGDAIQLDFVDAPDAQKKILMAKPCPCLLDPGTGNPASEDS